MVCESQYKLYVAKHSARGNTFNLETEMGLYIETDRRGKMFNVKATPVFM